MSDYAISLKRSTALAAALAFTATLLAFNLASIFGANVGAAQLTSRSLTLSSTLPGTSVTGLAGSETNGSDAIHTFNFTVPSATSVQSILFRYCTTAIGTCTAPTGLNVAGVTEGATSGLNAGWAIAGAATSSFRLDYVTGEDISGAVVVPVADIVNPTPEGTFFVRITTHTDTTPDTSGWLDMVDEGTVASAITDGIVITSRVAETLGFSTVGTTPTGALTSENGTACDALVGTGAIQLGDPSNEYTLSIATSFDAWSAFRLYTNSANGTVVQYEGATLTKGTDTIAPMAVKAVSAQGSEQFGLAIDQTANGGQITGADTTFGSTGQLDLIADYEDGAGAINGAEVAEFIFVADTPTTIATSATNENYVGCDTAVVRYVGNISPLTPAGTYTTTVVYSAVPTY